LDQAVPTGDIAAKVSLIDEKIKTQKENIDASRKALKQMDESVDQTMARSTDTKGADKAAALRRAQAKERAQLQNDIAKAQSAIASLNEERAPIAKELRKVEAEVGPIKYIAAFIYGDNPDQNLLERAVRWVIIVIVLVFDPLAVILLLASQYSFAWFRKQKEEDEQEQGVRDFFDRGREVARALDAGEPLPVKTQIVEYPADIDNEDADNDIVVVKEEPTRNFDWPPASDLWPFPKAEKPEEPKVIKTEEDNLKDIPVLENEETWAQRVIDENPVDQWNKMIEAAEAEAAKETTFEELDGESEEEKEAQRIWKSENPGLTIKFYREAFENGAVKELPWMRYLKPKADFVDDAAEEAKKWADENPKLDEAKEAQQWANERGHYAGLDNPNPVSWIENENGHQVKKTAGYQQNEEQSDSTVWQRIKDMKAKRNDG